MTLQNTIAGSAGAACAMLGPILVRAMTEGPANQVTLSLLIAGMVVGTLLFGLSRI